jgi:hypothetical protein
MFYAIFALVRALLVLVAMLTHPAPVHTTPAPIHRTAPAPVVHHPAPRTAPLTPEQAHAKVAALVASHHGHVTQWATYGYGATPGHYTALNAGVVAVVGPDQCVGYETYGTPGMFGDVYGFTGGDCS